MKAHRVVGDAELFGEIIDGPRALSQQGEESISRRVGAELQRWAARFSHLPLV
jgi:hypothetical protein